MSGSNVVQLVPNGKLKPGAPTARKPAPTKHAPVAGQAQLHDRYMLANQQKLSDALALAQCGLGLRGVHLLTGYPTTFLSGLFRQAGVQAQSGRRKTSLGDLIRNPLYHAAAGHFVAALHRLMATPGARLDARVFVTALRKHCLDTTGSIAEIHPDLLFALACSVADGTTTMQFCRSCRCDFALITDPSSLVSGNPYGCPGCREIGAVVGGVGSKSKARRKADILPTGISDLNIGKPLVRFPSQSPPKQVLQATLRALLA